MQQDPVRTQTRGMWQQAGMRPQWRDLRKHGANGCRCVSTAKVILDSGESRWCLSKGLECRSKALWRELSQSGSGLQMTLSAKKFAASLPPNARSRFCELRGRESGAFGMRTSVLFEHRQNRWEDPDRLDSLSTGSKVCR